MSKGWTTNQPSGQSSGWEGVGVTHPKWQIEKQDEQESNSSTQLSSYLYANSQADTYLKAQEIAPGGQGFALLFRSPSPRPLLLVHAFVAFGLHAADVIQLEVLSEAVDHQHGAWKAIFKSIKN